MLYKPGIKRIVKEVDVKEENESFKDKISCIVEDIFKRFNLGIRYPEIGRIYYRHRIIQEIPVDEFSLNHGRLIFKQSSNIYLVDEELHLSSFYGTDELDRIENMSDLNRVISFTKWLRQQYEALLKAGSPLVKAVMNDMTLNFGGQTLDPYFGILVLRYRDHEDLEQTQVYRYHFYKDDTQIHRVDLTADITISPVLSKYADGRRPPFKNGLRSLVCMSTNVPADLEDTTLKLAREVLLRKLIYLSETEQEVVTKTVINPTL